MLEPGAKGEKVRELQHRLFQMAWLPETTTGTYDATTKEAVAGFQGKRGFKATGVVDKRTWTKLVAMTKTPTHDQKFNVLKPGPALLAAGDVRRRASATPRPGSSRSPGCSATSPGRTTRRRSPR